MKSTLAAIALTAIVTILYILLFESTTLNKTTTQIVVVEKISLSNDESFKVSGKDFSFHTKELTFAVNDTIVIKGDLVYPKNNPALTVKKTWR